MNGFVRARITGVIDGDTIETRLSSGRIERVRLIGVDTPERGQNFFSQASALTSKLLPNGTEVFLETDVEKRDRFDRMLAYVWLKHPRDRSTPSVSGLMVNAKLMSAGLAAALTIPPNVRYSEIFLLLQRRATRGSRGFWKETALKVCDPSYPGVCIPPPPPDLDCDDISDRRFKVVGLDPHNFDMDRNGRGCES